MSETTNARERLFDALSAGVRGHALGPYLDEVEFAAIRLATPPTPDLDAVREAVIELLGYARSPQIARLSESLGLGRYVGKGTERHRVCQRIADAMLAAVSRPAEARGEPKVTDAMVDAVLDAMWEKPFTSADNAAAKIRWVLETALAAQREQTP